MPALPAAAPVRADVERQPLHTAAASTLPYVVLIAAVTVIVWIVHSRFLFSWDSANFAFAVDRIDIARHRPHPPGYLGYVFAARVLRSLTPTVTDAMVVWNLIALASTTIAIACFAPAAPPSRRDLVAAILVVVNPLVLFYASVAEIYVTELACVAAVACTIHHMLRGNRRAPLWCAVAAGVTALFKLPTFVLLLPAIAYAFARAPVGRRSRDAGVIALAAAIAAMSLVFLIVEPRIASIVWDQVLSATAGTRVVGATDHVDIGRLFNRNLRDVSIAALAALGFNAIGVLAWAARDRKMPEGIDGWFLLLWIVPWCFVLLFVHVGKPGYVLPLLPIAVILLADWYARLGTRTAIALATAGALANLAWFFFASTPANASTDARRYRDKPFVDRMASDLQPLTFPTAATIRGSDRSVEALLAAASACHESPWVVVAGSSGVDWRRAMFYAPSAMAIDVDDQGRFLFAGRNGVQSAIVEPVAVESRCGLLWLAARPPRITTDLAAQQITGVGWRYPPGAGRVTLTDLEWR